ncbi:MAG: DUF1501 domain-containing protein [Planctomycetota bacterium]
MNPTRRQVIHSLAGGGLILPGLLSELLAAEATETAQPPQPAHFAPKAKRVIFLFMTGGVSHVDTFDPKPYLQKNHDKNYRGRRFFKGSDWKFRRYGDCGLEVSDLFPEIGSMADEICMIRSMKNINGDHFGATIGIHTGSATFNRPSMGSWVSYGLGSTRRDLPAFMVISPGMPYGGEQSWGSDFLPVVHQGTRLVPGSEPVANLRRRGLSGAEQKTQLDLLRFLNAQHRSGRETDSALSARIESFETAFGMQSVAPEIFDLSGENDETHELYGLERGNTESFGWQCMVARRLAERGVRFIELNLVLCIASSMH